MPELNNHHIAFAIFSITSLILLIVLFISRVKKPVIEKRFGWIIYAVGIPAFIMAVMFIINGEVWYFILPLLIYCCWALFAAIVDIWKPVQWREPKYLPIFIPYVVLFIITMTGLWVPLWFINPVLWIVFATLYVCLMILVFISHKQASKTSTQ